MKKLAALLALCLILCACSNSAPAQTTAPAVQETHPATEPVTEETLPPTTQVPETTETPLISISLYTPNENADGFIVTPVTIRELDAHVITALLIDAGVLNEDVKINYAEYLNETLYLDFNEAFLAQLNTYGTAGERMMIGSVVNTFLSAYGVNQAYISYDGMLMESGHVIYDFTIGFME